MDNHASEISGEVESHVCHYTPSTVAITYLPFPHMASRLACSVEVSIISALQVGITYAARMDLIMRQCLPRPRKGCALLLPSGAPH